ncbi:MAG: class I mannose-6-phosphate isomerase [Candidatus Dormibacteraeota bacterium]|nr:class I mannose-6-phosphate isomerase [Candidatus Dormibacteraeota bacterium]
MTGTLPAGYRTHPVHEFPFLRVETGYPALARAVGRLLQSVSHRPPVAAVDGFIGVEWAAVRERLGTALEDSGQDVQWLSTGSVFPSTDEVNRRLWPFVTDDPVFGRLFRGRLEELWDPSAAQRLREALAARTRPTVVYGFGASLVAPEAPVVYIDVPKAVGQARAERGSITNVGAARPDGFAAMYKRMYFVDWPMLNRIKRGLLPRLDLFVDGSDLEVPAFTEGCRLRQALGELAQRPFRVKPWFVPGPWGGQWMKRAFGLDGDQPNYAWSYELIAPENGLLLGDGRRTLECSFDCLLWQESDSVLGPAVAARYGSYFPIRLDYLDTMAGGNLSCQVHPRLDYIRDEFGEPLTQDETYYIVTCDEGSQVHLGLREDADVDEFRRTAERARDQRVPFDIHAFVNAFPSHPHDLFLIPSGTVHCSGAGNLVLEISSTPYIYTFKIYDYLRADLRGDLRAVHLDRAFANLDGNRRTGWATEHLLPSPVPVRQGDTWAEYRLAHDPLLPFAVHRLEFQESIPDDTHGIFLALNLVEGERCWVETAAGAFELRSLESVVVPASVGSFRLRNAGRSRCRLVKAMVKV